jgi:uncharacterized YigZ family protein
MHDYRRAVLFAFITCTEFTQIIVNSCLAEDCPPRQLNSSSKVFIENNLHLLYNLIDSLFSLFNFHKKDGFENNMSKSYNMIKEYTETSFIERKSRFLSYAMPVYTEEEAVSFLNAIRKKHYDASHNCYAYILGENSEVQRSSDDGEPSGTAGIPILEVLKKENLTNTIVIVTRYFGGIMLGAGGLIRAYTEGAARAVSEAGIAEVRAFAIYSVKTDYSNLRKIQYEAPKKNYIIRDIEYSEAVSITILTAISEKDILEQDLNNWTLGEGIINYLNVEMIKIDKDTYKPI